MTQPHSDVPVAGRGLPRPVEGPRSAGSPALWLVLADPDGSLDPRRLFPDVDVRAEGTSAAFRDALASADPDLVILVAPPASVDDVQRVAAWHTTHPGTRTILLSPHLAVTARLQALEMGFDDAVDLSSDPLEVVGRLSIAGRRAASGSSPLDGRIALGRGVELDLRARAIRRDGRLLALRPRELALLEFLTAHPGQAFSREVLLDRVWHGSADNVRVVDVYVFWLRTKIEPDPANPTRLVTVRGAGYMFDPPWLGEGPGGTER